MNAARDSDLMSATQRSLPRIKVMMFRSRADWSSGPIKRLNWVAHPVFVCESVDETTVILLCPYSLLARA
jgi:hypothetical protein